ncbi:hypothetical protein [Halomonas mongoliensis]
MMLNPTLILDGIPVAFHGCRTGPSLTGPFLLFVPVVPTFW